MVGIFSWYGIPDSFENRIHAIRRAGFEATSIWLGNDEDEWEIDKNLITKIIRNNGLLIDYAHAPYRNTNHLWDQNKRHDLEKEIKEYINYCSKHEIGILVLHLTTGTTIKKATRNGIETLRGIVDHAKKRGVKIALENTEQNEILETVLDQIEDASLGLCFDTSHNHLYNKNNSFKLMTKYEERLLCLHLSDNNGLTDDHWLPYEGQIDWQHFVRNFPKRYKGILHLEVLARYKDEKEDFLQKAYEIIKRLEEDIYCLSP